MPGCAAFSGVADALVVAIVGESASVAVAASPTSFDVAAISGDGGEVSESSTFACAGAVVGASRAEGASGVEILPVAADGFWRASTAPDTSAEPGSARSMTVVSAAGVEGPEAMSRRAPPVATKSAETTTPPMISHRRTDVLGLLRADLSMIGFLLGAYTSATCGRFYYIAVVC